MLKKRLAKNSLGCSLPGPIHLRGSSQSTIWCARNVMKVRTNQWNIISWKKCLENIISWKNPWNIFLFLFGNFGRVNSPPTKNLPFFWLILTSASWRFTTPWGWQYAHWLVRHGIKNCQWWVIHAWWWFTVLSRGRPKSQQISKEICQQQTALWNSLAVRGTVSRALVLGSLCAEALERPGQI